MWWPKPIIPALMLALATQRASVSRDRNGTAKDDVSVLPSVMFGSNTYSQHRHTFSSFNLLSVGEFVTQAGLICRSSCLSLQRAGIIPLGLRIKPRVFVCQARSVPPQCPNTRSCPAPFILNDLFYVFCLCDSVRYNSRWN